ncbi:hypothetical protein XAP6164_230005 [Xanthomonas phaseoli pv. phaseoli]|nr:hypothetical protein XAP6164_230005 [Xanthomonas phaseoli pv. phaseoli]
MCGDVTPRIQERTGMLVMLIAERGGCLPAASMQWLLAAGNQPHGGGLFVRFAQCGTRASPGRRVGRCRCSVP